MEQPHSNVIDNKKYADSLFSALFADEQYRQDILSLYNYLTGTNSATVDDIQIVTIKDVIYLGRKNDFSFLIGEETLNLWEEQSTINPNMPLRGLLYFAKQLDGYIHLHRINLYSSSLQKIPTPKYVVFEFGRTRGPAKRELRLSDMFASDVPGDIEVKCIVYNISRGKNQALMSACKLLKDYTALVEQIKTKIKQCGHNDLMQAVDEAVEYCIKHNILADYLIKHRAEAKEMLFTLADKEFEEQCIREERERERKEYAQELQRVKEKSASELAEATDKARAEGHAEGAKEAATEVLDKLAKYLQKQHPEWTSEQCMEQAKVMTR